MLLIIYKFIICCRFLHYFITIKSFSYNYIDKKYLKFYNDFVRKTIFIKGVNMDNYNGHPMNWYKFLIYFALFASAVLNGLTAISYFTGGIYGSTSKDLVYRVFGNLKFVDIMMGVLLLAMAAFAIYVRMQLAGFKVSGPKMLYILYGASAVIQVIYTIIVYVTISKYGNPGELINLSTTFSSVAISIVMIVVNKIYFDKRRDLFVNP